MKNKENSHNHTNQAAQIADLEKRLKQLAASKSQLQLFAELINRLSHVRGLENVPAQIVNLLMGTLGGTNITLFYVIDATWHSIDALGTKLQLENAPDRSIEEALAGKKSLFIDAKTHTYILPSSSLREFSRGATWIIPLTFEDEAIGAIKMEGMMVVRPEMMDHLQPFINYATMVLKSEVEKFTKLRLAYDNIKAINKVLTKEIEERKKVEQELRESEKRFRSIFENTVIGMCMTSIDGKFLMVNPALCHILGYSDKELLNRKFTDFTHPDDVSLSYQKLQPLLDNTSDSEIFEKRYLQKSGKLIWATVGTSLLRDTQNTPQYFITQIIDISTRKSAEDKLKANELKFRTFFEHVTDYALILAPTHEGLVIVDLNQSACQQHGYSREEIIGKNLTFLDANSVASDDERIKHVMSGKVGTFETVHKRKDGTTFPVEATARLLDVEGQSYIFSIERDISTRKRNEREKAVLESQLLQAQKMEAVGQLAGGVAHDFNNMLGVILGHAEMAMEQMDPQHPISVDLNEIQKAAQRSADITRQLLAFARKQTVAPRVLDLNETIEGMLKMLRRLIGENIDLAWLPGTGLWPVNIDPSQIDQILANLFVNARAAIAGVGKISVETGNNTFDEEHCGAHAGYVQGEYVRIVVSDNGSGMDKETQSHIFEPFFTTKGVGVGTGLGLATVYGAIRQNNGFINVYSELGKGTTFTIYLPRHAGEEVHMATIHTEETAKRGVETILLVEDEPTILEMTKRMLQMLDYTVLTAGTPSEAIRMAGEFAKDIDLLITDVVMPEMNGQYLANNLLPIYPHLKCLFMSGYTSDIIARQGILTDGVQFIQKPFSKKDLAEKIRSVLEKS